MKKQFFVFLLVILVSITASAQSPFSEGRWQGRVTYKDAAGKTRSELYELILVPNGTCIVTVSGK